MIIGAHFSIRQGLVQALRQAESLDLEAIQIFGYRRHEFYFDPQIAPPTKKKIDDEVAAWHDALERSSVKRVVVHARHVAILALEEPERKFCAVEKLRQEIELARMLKAEFFVFHLGPYAQGSDLTEGLILACEALDHVLKDLPPGSPKVVVENVPGGGRRMGGAIEELAIIFNLLKSHDRNFGLCVDLAHLWGAGYKIDSTAGAEKFFESLREKIDPEQIALFHLNNTRAKFQSHIDDHWHLAEGVIEADVYRYLMNNWPGVIGILETPKDTVDADKKNIDFLRLLAR